MQVTIDGVDYVPAPQQPAPSTMDAQSARILYNQIDKSDLTYAMVSYSEYTGGRNFVPDHRFHQLRERFVAAHDELNEYLKTELKKHGLEFV